MNEHERNQVELARVMDRLMNNQDFIDIILTRFLKEDIVKVTLEQNLSSEATINALRARQELNKFISDIITEGEILLTENKEG